MRQLVQLRVGAPAHGGHCVARDADGRVVFVRHALPGELVAAHVTERAATFWLADAIEVLEASPDRVEAPCPAAGPGRCGGCDWQHATGAAQRAIKAAVVREQFARLANLDAAVTVEPLPGGLLGWRTRVQWALGADGTVGLRRHHCHEIEPVAHCPLGAGAVADAPTSPAPTARPGGSGDTGFAGLTGVEVVRGEDGAVTVLGRTPGRGRQPRGRRPPDAVRLLSGPSRLRHTVAGRSFEVDATGFWQVHPHAAQVFAEALLDMVAPRPGERVLDLYAGAGLLTALLAEAVGPRGAVVGVEISPQAVADAQANLADLPQARVVRGRVSPQVVRDTLDGANAGQHVDVVVLDPPRSGAGREVMAAVTARARRAVGYVSCEPATLARDVRVALDAGWRLAQLRAFDAFPMTQHVECVAVLVRG